ncbi:MAG TPA: DUF6328 family protein [Cryptosporangiaceae bacterium]|nr:DUF6328 family protein [Cryptosporangiaceae bacterium]
MPDTVREPRDVDPDRSGSSDLGRNETELERLDRNFSELLQELRVAQAGVQILFAFLLAVAFTERFARVADDFVHTVYVVTVVCALGSVGFLIAPVAYHRQAFRRHMKREVVATANRLAQAGLAFLAVALAGALLLILEVTLGRTTALFGAAVALVWLLAWWFAIPMARVRQERGAESP